MDKTKQNILMCEKAREIQKHKAWNDFDVFCDGESLWQGNVLMQSGVDYEIADNSQFIWLPYQSQLQKMLIMQYPECVDLDYLNNRFKKILSKPIDSYGWTWEKLWLALVMELKYSKQWSIKQKDWIKELK